MSASTRMVSRRLSKLLIGPSILLTAQPFGFGPSTAASLICHHLKKAVPSYFLGYTGIGHTLDMQITAPYDRIYPCDVLNSVDCEIQQTVSFSTICAEYDVVLSICDFDAAEIAKKLGKTVILYDPIPWFWPSIPSIISSVDLYVAQDFFTVRDRITATENATKFPTNTLIIPALPPPVVRNTITAITSSIPKQKLLLINFGGLSNPFISDTVLVGYCQTVLSVCKELLFHQFTRIVVLANRVIAAKCAEYLAVDTTSETADTTSPSISVLTLNHSATTSLMGEADFILLTPGLGNMYDTKAHCAPSTSVVWLPPTNASQGMQMRMLLEADPSHTVAMDWHEFLPHECDNTPLPYLSDEPVEVAKLDHVMHRFPSLDLRDAFRSYAQSKFECVTAMSQCSPSGTGPISSSIPLILSQFGENGIEIVIQQVQKVTDMVMEKELNSTSLYQRRVPSPLYSIVPAMA